MSHLLQARAVCLAGAAALLGACATPPLPQMQSAQTVSGRLAVKVEEAAGPRSVTAQFELRTADRRGDLRLSSPLGTQLALATWDAASGATLTTSQGVRSYPDLAALSQDALGVALPLGALTHWLTGRPWPEAPSHSGQAGFEQLGWQIDLSRYADDALIVASRTEPPAVTVRARIDR